MGRYRRNNRLKTEQRRRGGWKYVRSHPESGWIYRKANLDEEKARAGREEAEQLEDVNKLFVKPSEKEM